MTAVPMRDRTDAQDCSSPDCIANAVYEIVRHRLAALRAPVPAEGLDVALLLAVEEVDNAWHDEGDHIEYHEELPERLITLRARLAALSPFRPDYTMADVVHDTGCVGSDDCPDGCPEPQPETPA